MKKMKPQPTTELVTKAEALEKLASFMRQPRIDSNLLIKIISLMEKIGGWNKVSKPPEKTVQDLVVELEHKRKEQQQNPIEK